MPKYQLRDVQDQSTGPGFVVVDGKGIPLVCYSFPTIEEAREAREALSPYIQNMTHIETYNM